MPTFEIGTVVRFASERNAQAYGSEIYGRLTGFVIGKVYSRGGDGMSYVLHNLDGSLAQPCAKYFNYAPAICLEIDPFLNAARQAILSSAKESQCPTSKS